MAETIERAPAIETHIDYLIPTSRINRRFWAPGAEMNTGVYRPYPVTIRNARAAGHVFTLDEHGFALLDHRSEIRNWRDEGEPEALYPAEVEALVCDATGADFVVPLGGFRRSSGQTRLGLQPPAAEAHVDFTTHTANRLARVLYAKAEPAGPGFSRFLSFSLWRTYSDPPQDWPLALCEGRSVGDEEGVPNVKVDVDELPVGNACFAPVAGEEDMAAASIFHHNPAHRWWYYPEMTVDEAILIKFHDSDHARAWRAPHTAFHDPRPDAHIRESYEYRAFAFFRA